MTTKLFPAYLWVCEVCGKDRVARPVESGPPATVHCDWCGADYDVETEAKPEVKAEPIATPEPEATPEAKPSEPQ